MLTLNIIATIRHITEVACGKVFPLVGMLQTGLGEGCGLILGNWRQLLALLKIAEMEPPSPRRRIHLDGRVAGAYALALHHSLGHAHGPAVDATTSVGDPMNVASGALHRFGDRVGLVIPGVPIALSAVGTWTPPVSESAAPAIGATPADAAEDLDDDLRTLSLPL